MRMTAVLLLVALAGFATAAPPALTVTPAAPKAGDVVTVSSPAPVKFRVPAGLAVLASPDGRSIAFFLPAASVTLLAAASDPAPLADVAVVAVGTGGPIPPAPPAPAPPAPAPPAPGPPAPSPPAPADPLAQRLKAAYDADPTPGEKKPEARKNLAALYRAAVATCGDASVGTAGQMLDVLRKASAAMVGTDLMGVRTLVGDELKRYLPTDAGEALSPAHRAAAADLFKRLAAALEALP
jgi:hypothetical protein